MSNSWLTVAGLERRLATGKVEALKFQPGVNLMVGRPNTGKTKWLETLDFLLGDSGDNPFAGAEEAGLADKYDAAAAQLIVGEKSVRIERRWRESGSKTKIFVNDQGMPAREFQHWLMDQLGIPRLNFPKGNPMSGQTWPELSFRMLLRHIYRQQRFWGDIADKQPEGEQHACLLQFLGLAERIYAKEYGQLIERKAEVERLKTRREQYGQTLDELAREVLADSGMTVSVTAGTVKAAQERLAADVNQLRQRRTTMLSEGQERAFNPDQRSHVAQLGNRRADVLADLEENHRRTKVTIERKEEVKRYRADLADEFEKLERAEVAGAVLADLRITHCPACDQPVAGANSASGDCFLCHQHLPDELVVEELGAVRLRFESDRLTSELDEADDLLSVLDQETRKLAKEAKGLEENLRDIESELTPAREAVAGLVQEEVSAIDMALGKANERERQLRRIGSALNLETDLTERIGKLEKEIAPLQERVDELSRATDYEAAATLLEDGMNAYLNAINVHRPGVWRHSDVRVDISKTTYRFQVGPKRWNAVLGGTDTLYFLMAYHYGLLSLSAKTECHYPGLSVIDLPGEFSGEAVEDKENFIIQPFIDLLNTEGYAGSQLIMTGAAFVGLEGAKFMHFNNIYVA